MMYKIIMFGNGGFANYLMQKLRTDRAEIIACVDSINKDTNDANGQIPIISLEQIDQYPYDYLVIGFSDVRKGLDKLQSYGIPREKIVAYSFTNSDRNYNENYWQTKIDHIIHTDFNDVILPEIFDVTTKNNYLCSMNLEEIPGVIESDYVREQTLALIAKEISRKQIRGGYAS